MIFTTAYVSTLVEGLAGEETDELLKRSRASNARAGISGMLVFRGRRVLQLLEGAEADVRDLFHRISADPRHTDVVTVWSSTGQQRRFPDWTMGFDDLSAEDAELPSALANWPEPAFDQFGTVDVVPSAEDDTAHYIARRAAALRRALVSGDRLVASLAIILHGHRPESTLGDDGAVRLRCAECRLFDSPDLNRYPCSTAKNAIWALEAVQR